MSFGSKSAIVYQIYDFSLKYGDITIFNMAPVHHLGFVAPHNIASGEIKSQYCAKFLC